MFIVEKETDVQAKLIKRARVTALANSFARVNSVLTGNLISVNVVDEPTMGAPAWSSTHEVWLNLAQIADDFSARSLLSLNGLNFHEYSHLRYTARTGHPLVQWVKENNLWQAFNALEDSRIENLTVSYLPSTKGWLTSTIVDYILKDTSAIEVAFPLVTGRRYLPIELQQLAVDNYKRPQDIDELYSVVDEYIGLLFVVGADDTELAKPLIKKFAELIEQLPPCGGNNGGAGDDEGTTIVYRIKNTHHNGRPTEGYESSSVRPANAKEQKRDRDKAKANDTTTKPKRKVIVVDVEVDEGGCSFGDDEGTTPSDTSKEDKSGASDTGAGDTGDNFSDEFDFDTDEFDDSDVDTSFGESRSAGNKAGTTGENTQVTSVLNDVLDSVTKELSNEINQIAKQLGITLDLNGGNVSTPKRADFNDVQVPAELNLLAKSFGKELERLRSNHEPYWETHTDSGRISVERFCNGDDFDSVFDEWYEGKDDVTSIEAVILLDKSGSMGGDNADNAYKSMWAIKKALEKVEARTTVCLFDYSTTLLYSAEEVAGNTIRDGGASGGTNPENAILYAKNVLANSEKKVKLLFMITDGAWETEQGEKAVSEMRSAGVLTCQAYLSRYDESPAEVERVRHSFELLTHIRTAKDIMVLGKDLVRLAVARNLVNA